MENKSKKLTSYQIKAAVDIEGLAYAVTDYYGKDIICTDDAELEIKWKAAYTAFEDLKNHLETINY